MLMKDDKKKMATVIVAKMRGGSERYPEVPEKDGAQKDMSPHDVMAEEIAHAIKSGDNDALKDALKSFVCQTIEEYNEDDGSDDEDEKSSEPTPDEKE